MTSTRFDSKLRAYPRGAFTLKIVSLDLERTAYAVVWFDIRTRPSMRWQGEWIDRPPTERVFCDTLPQLRQRLRGLL